MKDGTRQVAGTNEAFAKAWANHEPAATKGLTIVIGVWGYWSLVT